MRNSFMKWMSQAIIFTFFTACVFFAMKWLEINVGTAVVWISGIVIYWILSAITILPWNLFFKADDVLEDMRKTEEKDKDIDAKDKEYAIKMKKISGIAAIAIHLVTASVFFIIAILNSNNLYYIASVAALCLTVLRPFIRSIQHALGRLSTIHHNAKFPRDDVFELKRRIDQLEYYDETAKELKKTFDKRYKDLIEQYNESCAHIQKQYQQNEATIRNFEKQLMNIHSEIIDKIDSFDDAVAFKTAWDRVAPELAKIFRGS